MKKSLIALFLVMALVLTVSVFAVSAETTDIDFSSGGTVTAKCEHCGTTVQWTPFDQTVLATGHYYLADSTLTEDTVSGLGDVYAVGSQMKIAAGNEICLHLNGNTMYREGGAPFNVSGALAVMDHEANEGMLRGRPWTSVAGGCIGVAAGGALTIHGGTIQPVIGTGNRASAYYGCGIHVNGGSLKITGGTITGGVTKNYISGGKTIYGRGGNIYMTGEWKFEMTGGTVSNGNASSDGGNIYFSSKSSSYTDPDACLAKISGGTITGGVAGTSGGNIHIAQDSNLILTNCLVTKGTCNNTDTAVTAVKGGGNIAHSSGARTTVGAGAVVSDGVSKGAGGNFVQVYGGSAQKGLITVTDGGQVLGGTAVVGGSIANGNNNSVLIEKGGIISGGTATGNGGNIWARAASGGIANIEVATGGTLTKGTATGNGGNIYVDTLVVKTTVSGGTISDGSAASGGNIYINIYATGGITMTAGTISGGTATGNGGNIYHGQSAGAFTMSGGTISGGNAKIGGGYAGAWGSTLNMSGDAKFDSNTSTQAGGNIHAAGINLNITGGTITKGTAGSYGGNIATDGSAYGTITNATITAGSAANGGNIGCNHTSSNQTADAARAAGLTLGAGTVLSGGKATTFGGNLYASSMYAIVTLDGAVLNGTSATGLGRNIGIWNVDKLIIKGDSIVYGGVYNNSIYMGDNDDDNPTDTSTFDLKIELDGNAAVDYIMFGSDRIKNGKTFDLASLTIKKDFAGAAKLAWAEDPIELDGSLKKIDYNKPGTKVGSNVIVEEGYADAATIYVLDETSSQKPVAYYDTNADGVKELATTGMVGVKADADGNAVETIITELPTDDTYDYIKLYAEGVNITLKQDLLVDHNSMDVHFITGNHKLTVMNYRNDDGKIGTKDEGFTVDNVANLNRIGVNPINGKQYVIIVESETDEGVIHYSSHHLKVDIDSVSIKPATADLYYNVNIVTNAKLAKYLGKYGVALDLTAMPDAGFGSCDTTMYTEEKFSFTEGEGAKLEGVRSCLLTGILPTQVVNGEKSGEMPIFANAYVTLPGLAADGDVLTVMADNPVNYSLWDIMLMVNANEELATNAAVVEMYKKFIDDMGGWKLDKIAAAAAA